MLVTGRAGYRDRRSGPSLAGAPTAARGKGEHVGLQSRLRLSGAGTIGISIARVGPIRTPRQETGLDQGFQDVRTERSVHTTQTLDLFRAEREPGHLEVFGTDALEYLRSNKCDHGFPDFG